MDKIIKFILILVFFAFVVSYIIYETGYYEYKLQNKTVLTTEEMKKFEEDVKEGKDVDLNSYLVETEKDYSNNLTRSTVRVSTTVNNYLKKSIEKVFKQINKLVES